MESHFPADANPSARSLKKDLLAALFVLLASSALFAMINRPWQSPARLPRAYAGDYLVYLVWVETMIEEGSYVHNSRVGRPLGTDWRGFPTSDGWLNWQLIRALTLVRPEPAWALNWFYWLTFPMVGLSAFVVARLLGISRALAVSLALLYDFLPYHVLRSEHVFMTAYYLIPWSVYACLQWRSPDNALGRWNRPTFTFFALAVLTGLGYVYYAYFACILMMTAGIARSTNDRRLRPLLCSVLWGGLVMVTLTGTMAPEIRHKLSTPKNPDAPQRSPAEAEIYAFKIPQLMFPAPDHQIRMLAKLREHYENEVTLVSDRGTCALGMVGTAGLLCLLWRFVFRRFGAAGDDMDLPALFAAVIVMLATVGGFAAIINWTQAAVGMTPWIRCYNRISIVLGFVVLTGLAMLADRRRNKIQTPSGHVWFVVLTAAVTAWGIFDQTPRKIGRNQAANLALFESDAEYFPQIESRGVPGDFVFLIGYRYYPECPIEPFTDYAHYRPYLHAKSLTFSYGALRGEANDAWCRNLSNRPVSELIDHLARMEALGLLIYRPSLGKDQREVEGDAEAILGEKPFVSPDGQFAFFNLRSRSELLRSVVPAEEWAVSRARLRQPIVPVWRKGFSPDADPYVRETTKVTREFGRESEIRVSNDLGQTRRLELRFDVKVVRDFEATETRWLRINQNNQDEIVPVPPEGATLERTFNIPPGETVIRLTTAFERSQFELGGTPKHCLMIMSKMSWAEK